MTPKMYLAFTVIQAMFGIAALSIMLLVFFVQSFQGRGVVLIEPNLWICTKEFFLVAFALFVTVAKALVDLTPKPNKQVKRVM